MSWHSEEFEPSEPRARRAATRQSHLRPAARFTCYGLRHLPDCFFASKNLDDFVVAEWRVEAFHHAVEQFELFVGEDYRHARRLRRTMRVHIPGFAVPFALPRACA